MLIDRILQALPEGTPIPKPDSTKVFTLGGEETSHGERAIAYRIPLGRKPGATGVKRITSSQLEAAYKELCRTGEITKAWWREHAAYSDGEGGCNFTTVGGLLILLGEAERAGRGKYRRVLSTK